MTLFFQRSVILTLVITAALALGACSRTQTFIAVNVDESKVALRGFDAVAYFVVDNAVEGNKAYEYVWNGAKWYFANAENLDKFRKQPEVYAPQFGGYCSYAVSKGYTADGDPQAWSIVDGKLYLNYSPKVKEMWEQERDANIAKAAANWPGFKENPPEHK